MHANACSGCYRVCYDGVNCPECGRKLIVATKAQQRAFSIHSKERHFSPNGLRLDRADSLPQQIIDMKKVISDLELEFSRIDRFIREGIDV